MWRNLGRHKASECTPTRWLKRANGIIPLHLPSCRVSRVWAGSTHLLSPSCAPGKAWSIGWPAAPTHQLTTIACLTFLHPAQAWALLHEPAGPQQRLQMVFCLFNEQLLEGAGKGQGWLGGGSGESGCSGAGGGEVGQWGQLCLAQLARKAPCQREVALFKSCCTWRLSVCQESGVSVESHPCWLRACGPGWESVLHLIVGKKSPENNRDSSTQDIFSITLSSPSVPDLSWWISTPLFPANDSSILSSCTFAAFIKGKWHARLAALPCFHKCRCGVESLHWVFEAKNWKITFLPFLSVF